MPSCNICIDTLKEPLSLPCGHVFCRECIARAVTTIKPTTIFQPCPTCRTLYSIAGIDSTMIPPSIRPHVTSSIRRLYLDETSTESTRSTSAAVSECGRLTAENRSLRVNCAVWKKRAEIHAAATIGLMQLAQAAKHCNQQLKNERDELERQCKLLKRKLEAEESFALAAPVVSSSPQAPVSSNLVTDILTTSFTEAAPCDTAIGISHRRMSSHVSSVPNSRSRLTRAAGISPQEQNLPPSLKRRKTDADTGICSSNEVGYDKHLPLALRKSPRLKGFKLS